MGRQPQSHRTREPFVRRPRGDRCGLATHYLHACGISFSQRLFEEGAVIHAHFTGGETKPQSSHATFPKIRGKTQALHPGPRGAVFAALLLCGTADPTSAATLRCHVEGPESCRTGLRFGPLLSSALAFEARTRPSAASTVNVRRVHCRWPRRCCRARGSGPRAETRVTPSGSWPRGSPGHPGPAGAFPAGPRGAPSRGRQACGGRGRGVGAGAGSSSAPRACCPDAPRDSAGENRPPGRGRPVCFLLVCSGERETLPASPRGGARLPRLGDQRIAMAGQRGRAGGASPSGRPTRSGLCLWHRSPVSGGSAGPIGQTGVRIPSCHRLTLWPPAGPSLTLPPSSRVVWLLRSIFENTECLWMDRVEVQVKQGQGRVQENVQPAGLQPEGTSPASPLGSQPRAQRGALVTRTSAEANVTPELALEGGRARCHSECPPPCAAPAACDRGNRGGGGGQVARSGSVIKCLRISSCCPFCSPAPSRFYLSEMCSNISSRPWGTGSACNAGVTFWRMNATFVSICRSEY